MLHVFAAGRSLSCPDLSFNVTALIIIAQVIIARRYFRETGADMPPEGLKPYEWQLDASS